MQTMTTTISPDELKSRLARGDCHLVDVREPVEYADEHVAGARLIPLGEIDRRGHEIPRDQTIVIMCRSGKRGGQALAKLHAQGLTGVMNLEGGILAWKEAGNPVRRAERKVFPLMQQVQLIIGLGVLTGAVLSLAVHPYWVFLSAFFGTGLVFAGSTGWCGLAMLMSKMPWNRVAGQPSCDSGSCLSSN